MADSSRTGQAVIVVAIIGLIGTLGAALIANWDSIFGDDGGTTTTSSSTSSPTTSTTGPGNGIDYRIAPTSATMLAEWLDLDDGRVDATPGADRRLFELLWVCGVDDSEALRLENAEEGAAWATFHVTADLGDVTIVDLEGGAYGVDVNPDTGYVDLFHEHKSNAPVIGSTYLIRTEMGNYGAVRIAGYGQAAVGVCRDISLEYFSWSP